MKIGTMTTPLHSGKAPAWLFNRMIELSREILGAIIIEFGTHEFLLRISDPNWFQSVGCVLGFDWHSSGVTTTVCGSLKEGIKGLEQELGLYICGGKGGRSRKTPSEIEAYCDHLAIDPSPLIRSSRLTAKVDNNALQDGYQLYHHTFFFDKSGNWSVVQQGMNADTVTARRYHWTGIDLINYIEDPHSGICSDKSNNLVFNLIANESKGARNSSIDILNEGPDWIITQLNKIKNYSLPKRHSLLFDDINPKNIRRTFIQTYEQQPQDFTSLLEARMAGPKTIRALALLSEVIYGTKVSQRDPAVFTFAHGGKDGTPYPIDKKVYDQSIQILKIAVEKARIGDKDKLNAIKRLSNLCSGPLAVL